MSCGIYCIENLINHKMYIGQSINIENRWINHKWYSSILKTTTKNTRNLKTAIHVAMKKYGTDNFQLKILEYTSPEELDEKE